MIVYSHINKLLLTCGIRALGLRTHVFPFKMNMDRCFIHSMFGSFIVNFVWHVKWQYPIIVKNEKLNETQIFVLWYYSVGCVTLMSLFSFIQNMIVLLINWKFSLSCVITRWGVWYYCTHGLPWKNQISCTIVLVLA